MTAEDLCCAVCYSTSGVCLSLHQCHHHKAAQRQLEADDRARRTYRDPVVDQVLRNLDRRPRTRGRRR